MDNRRLFAAGAGVGAGLMYVLDPERGRRRRALARDQLMHLVRKAEDGLDATARDVANRARGVTAKVRAWVEPEGDVPDVRVEQRVRTELGHCCSHPGAVEVSAEDGRVTLRGAVLADEREALLAAVRRVRGVTAVEDRLEAHERSGDVPDLQGGRRREGRRFELMQSRWSPTARVLVVAAAAPLLASPRVGGLLRLLGAVMAARAMTNVELRRLFGVGGGRRAVDVQKSLEVDAPVAHVFAFWRDYRNFPKFMSHVSEVEDRGDGRSRWTVDGPGGVPVRWDAEITALVPNEVLAWKTLPGSTVAHAGIVRFESAAGGGTRLDVRLSYNPPAGVIGHGVAALLGADAKRRIDGDLARVKTLLETGRAAHDAARPGPDGPGRRAGGRPTGA